MIALMMEAVSTSESRLGDAMVSTLATGPKIHGFKPGTGDGFLKAIKIPSTHSFRGKYGRRHHAIRVHGM
jgi:hypothetical protein